MYVYFLLYNLKRFYYKEKRKSLAHKNSDGVRVWKVSAENE